MGMQLLEGRNMLDGQVIADMLSGGSVMLEELQKHGQDEAAELQMSGSLAALGIVLAVDLESYIQDAETCDAIRATFQRMREIGETIRLNAIQNG